MKFKLNLKEKVTEAAEHVYDVVKREDYAIRIAPKGIIDCEKTLSKTAQ